MRKREWVRKRGRVSEEERVREGECVWKITRERERRRKRESERQRVRKIT